MVRGNAREQFSSVPHHFAGDRHHLPAQSRNRLCRPASAPYCPLQCCGGAFSVEVQQSGRQPPISLEASPTSLAQGKAGLGRERGTQYTTVRLKFSEFLATSATKSSCGEGRPFSISTPNVCFAQCFPVRERSGRRITNGSFSRNCSTFSIDTGSDMDCNPRLRAGCQHQEAALH